MSSQLTIDQILRIGADPCENRHLGNAESVAAHKKVIHTKEHTYKEIMDVVQARGDFGATSKEICYAVGRPLHAISGRLSEMKEMGRVRDSGIRREGCAVLVVGSEVSK